MFLIIIPYIFSQKNRPATASLLCTVILKLFYLSNNPPPLPVLTPFEELPVPMFL